MTAKHPFSITEATSSNRFIYASISSFSLYYLYAVNQLIHMQFLVFIPLSQYWQSLADAILAREFCYTNSMYSNSSPIQVIGIHYSLIMIH
jgi:hypothetical protein